jgi:hypothetical protein
LFAVLENEMFLNVDGDPTHSLSMSMFCFTLAPPSGLTLWFPTLADALLPFAFRRLFNAPTLPPTLPAPLLCMPALKALCLVEVAMALLVRLAVCGRRDDEAVPGLPLAVILFALKCLATGAIEAVMASEAQDMAW